MRLVMAALPSLEFSANNGAISSKSSSLEKTAVAIHKFILATTSLL